MHSHLRHAQIQKIPSIGSYFFLNYQHISHRDARISIKKQLTQGMYFLKKQIATCNFPGGGGKQTLPLDLPMYDQTLAMEFMVR